MGGKPQQCLEITTDDTEDECVDFVGRHDKATHYRTQWSDCVK